MNEPEPEPEPEPESEDENGLEMALDRSRKIGSYAAHGINRAIRRRL